MGLFEFLAFYASAVFSEPMHLVGFLWDSAC